MQTTQIVLWGTTTWISILEQDSDLFFFFFLQRQNESLCIKQIQFTDHCYINLSHRFTRYLLYDLRQTHTLEALVFLRNTLCKNYMKIPFKFLQTLATFYWPYQPQKALQYILWPYVRNLTKPGGRINMNIPTWQWPLQVLSNHHTEFNMGIKCSPPGWASPSRTRGQMTIKAVLPRKSKTEIPVVHKVERTLSFFLICHVVTPTCIHAVFPIFSVPWNTAKSFQ